MSRTTNHAQTPTISTKVVLNFRYTTCQQECLASTLCKSLFIPSLSSNCLYFYNPPPQSVGGVAPDVGLQAHGDVIGTLFVF